MCESGLLLLLLLLLLFSIFSWWIEIVKYNKRKTYLCNGFCADEAGYS